jgi:hypothetical protein
LYNDGDDGVIPKWSGKQENGDAELELVEKN